MKYRKHLQKGKSKKMFRNSSGVHPMNIPRMPRRGGIRL